MRGWGAALVLLLVASLSVASWYAVTRAAAQMETAVFLLRDSRRPAVLGMQTLTFDYVNGTSQTFQTDAHGHQVSSDGTSVSFTTGDDVKHIVQLGNVLHWTVS